MPENSSLDGFEIQEYGPELLLAYTRIRFNHPVTKQPVSLAALIEGNFKQLLEQFNWLHLI